MISCDSTTLLNLAKCFTCLSTAALLSVKTYLACQYANTGGVAPDAPTDPDILSTSTNASRVVSWSQGSAPTTNEVWRSQNGGAYALFASVAGGTTQKADTDAMVALDEWCYEIRACTGSCSAFTSPVCVLKEFRKFVNNGTVTYSFPEVVFHLGDLDISNQLALTSVAFANLHTCTGYVAVYQNPIITSINFDKLVSTAGLCQVAVNPAQTSMSFPSLTTVGADFVISQNATMTSLSIPLLATVGGNFYLNNGSIITNFLAPSLLSIEFNLLGSGTGSTTVSMPALTTIGNSGGNIDLSVNANLTSISMPSLVFVGGDVGCNDSTSLTTLDFSSWIILDGTTIDFTNCALTAASVNHILARGIASGVTSCQFILDAGTNSAPTGQGIIDKATLIGAGNTVVTN